MEIQLPFLLCISFFQLVSSVNVGPSDKNFGSGGVLTQKHKKQTFNFYWYLVSWFLDPEIQIFESLFWLKTIHGVVSVYSEEWFLFAMVLWQLSGHTHTHTRKQTYKLFLALHTYRKRCG